MLYLIAKFEREESTFYSKHEIIFSQKEKRRKMFQVKPISKVVRKMNPHSIVARMSRNSLLKAGRKSEVEVTTTGLKPTTAPSS